MRTLSRTTWAVGAISLALLAGGCGEGRFHVEVSLDNSDPGLRDKMGSVRSIEVNFVGVNDVELPRWEQVPVGDYWEPDNAMRASAKKHVMTFGQGHPDTQVLKKADPIWRTWLEERKGRHLVILAYLPWIQQGQPGQADPRRIILPLTISRWDGYLWGADTIRVQVGAGGLTSLRQPKQK